VTLGTLGPADGLDTQLDTFRPYYLRPRSSAHLDAIAAALAAEREPKARSSWADGLSPDEALREAARRQHQRMAGPERDPFAPKVLDLPAMLRARAAAVLAGAPDAGLGLIPAIPKTLGMLALPERRETAAPLVNTRVEFPPLRKSLDVRQLRALVRNHVRGLFKANSNLRKCGERRFAGLVDLRGKTVDRQRDGKTTRATVGMVAGVVRCGSVHSCVKCAPRIGAIRARQVKAVVSAHRAATATAEFPEGAVDMLTLTVPHERQMPCKKTRAALSEAWKLFQTGKSWVKLKKRLGFVGSIAAREITHGGHGWHPHLHILIAHASPWTEAERARLEFILYRRWVACVARVTGFHLSAPSREHGCKLTASHRDDYISKLGLSDELVGAIHKTGRGKNRTPFEIMAHYANGKDPRDAKLIAEHVKGTKGSRQLTWSRGKAGAADLRQIYAAALHALDFQEPEQPDLGDEYQRAFETDLELVVREDREGTRVRTLPGRQWDAIVRILRRVGGDAESELQLAIEQGGNDAVIGVIAAARALGMQLSEKDPRLRQWLPYLEIPDAAPAPNYTLRTPRGASPLPLLS
jgi:hypothetical protein